ncbi:hypothetical membrane protein [Halogranum amylolyticum]|uniref:Hypothetical membrane protein n=1 Tax=Halogranum amylolyticum TaxID=660520 RepID=A0A1H8U3Q7_9EURY|nr:DUF998 domain-containing protein [Halogranum amylolyticum]SEO97765.1 hypothetical membrane protein [Halogranum amylolyticum]
MSRRQPSNAPVVARLAGHAAPVVTLGAILLATVVSDTFAWTDSALSDLGVAAATAPLFNGGLVVGGLLALPFAYALWVDGRGPLGRLTAVAFALAATTMGLVGVFVSGHPLHLPVALSFYLLVTATLVLDGVARRTRRAGQLSALLGVAHLAGWVLWVSGSRFGTGLAVPEFVGAVVFAAWMLGLSPSGSSR